MRVLVQWCQKWSRWCGRNHSAERGRFVARDDHRGIGQVLIADSSGNALQQSLCKLAMHTVEAKKYRLSHAQNDIREVRCRLDDKECEVEELQECITRLKNDHMRKLNELRKESEDKVGALMTKLRAAEARTLEAEKTIRTSKEDFAVLKKKHATNDVDSHMKANLIPTASGYLAMDTAMPEMEMYQSFESHRAISRLDGQQIFPGSYDVKQTLRC